MYTDSIQSATRGPVNKAQERLENTQSAILYEADSLKCEVGKLAAHHNKRGSHLATPMTVVMKNSARVVMRVPLMYVLGTR